MSAKKRSKTRMRAYKEEKKCEVERHKDTNGGFYNPAF